MSARLSWLPGRLGWLLLPIALRAQKYVDKLGNRNRNQSADWRRDLNVLPNAPAVILRGKRLPVLSKSNPDVFSSRAMPCPGRAPDAPDDRADRISYNVDRRKCAPRCSYCDLSLHSMTYRERRPS